VSAGEPLAETQRQDFWNYTPNSSGITTPAMNSVRQVLGEEEELIPSIDLSVKMTDLDEANAINGVNNPEVENAAESARNSPGQQAQSSRQVPKSDDPTMRRTHHQQVSNPTYEVPSANLQLGIGYNRSRDPWQQTSPNATLTRLEYEARQASLQAAQSNDALQAATYASSQLLHSRNNVHEDEIISAGCRKFAQAIQTHQIQLQSFMQLPAMSQNVVRGNLSFPNGQSGTQHARNLNIASHQKCPRLHF
jgi:hypothetical protein